MGLSTENSAFAHRNLRPGADFWRIERSAAAVAAHFAPLAPGSTRGPIRQPAALCGVVGENPFTGGVAYWLVAFASSWIRSPMARNVETPGNA